MNSPVICIPKNQVTYYLPYKSIPYKIKNVIIKINIYFSWIIQHLR